MKWLSVARKWFEFKNQAYSNGFANLELRIREKEFINKELKCGS